MPTYKKYVTIIKQVKGKSVELQRLIGTETHTEISAAEINGNLLKYGFKLVKI